MAKSERSEAKGAVRIVLSQSEPGREAVDCIADSHAIQFLTTRLRVRFNGLNVWSANLVRKKFTTGNGAGKLRPSGRLSIVLPIDLEMCLHGGCHDGSSRNS